MQTVANIIVKIFNFAPKFHQNGRFPSPSFVFFLEENFPKGEYGGVAVAPPCGAMTPLLRGHLIMLIYLVIGHNCWPHFVSV